MIIEVTGHPKFYLPLTRNQIAMLMKLASTHYDRTCRDAGSLGGMTFINPPGFLRIWDSSIEVSTKLSAEYDDPASAKQAPTVEASWGQIDTCMKIMESVLGLTPEQTQLRNSLSRVFSELLVATGAAVGNWKMIFDAQHIAAWGEGS
jgi:hypothetical protein